MHRSSVAGGQIVRLYSPQFRTFHYSLILDFLTIILILVRGLQPSI